MPGIKCKQFCILIRFQEACSRSPFFTRKLKGQIISQQKNFTNEKIAPKEWPNQRNEGNLLHQIAYDYKKVPLFFDFTFL